MKKINTRAPRELDLPNLSLRDIVAPLFRKKQIAIFTFSVVFGLSALLAWGWAARYYSASMQIVVEQDRSDPTLTSGQNAAVVSRGITIDQVTSEVALLQGRDMFRSVAETCGLATPEPSFWDKYFPVEPEIRKAMLIESAAAKLAGKIKVEAVTTSDVIDVKYSKSGSPETPACVLQNLGKLYLEKHLRLRRPSGTTEFFAREAEEYRKGLAEAEARLIAFSREQGTGSPDLLRTPIAEQIALTEAGLHRAEQSVEVDLRRILSLKQQMDTTPSRSQSSEVSNAAKLLIQNLQGNLLVAKLKRAQLAMKYDAGYPLVREADQEIAETEDAIAKAQTVKYVDRTTDRDLTYEYLRQDFAKTQSDLASDKASAAALENTLRSMRAEMMKLDVAAVQQASLQREAKANEANYLLYLGKREQERTSDALDQRKFANVAISVPPVASAMSAYNPMMFLAIGFVLAALTGFAAAYVAEHLDPSFRTPSEVTDVLGIPVLASFPKVA